MRLEEFSDGFDTLVDSYRRFKDFDDKNVPDSIEFDEYEKSLYLTKAQEEIVIGLYNGTIKGASFEQTEEMHRSLATLIRQKNYSFSERITNASHIVDDSYVFQAPMDLLFIIHEQLIIINPCTGNLKDRKSIAVYPIKHDEYNKIKENPFRGPTRYKALRIDGSISGSGESSRLEIISKGSFMEYVIRYLAKPTPIVLTELPNGVSIDGTSVQADCMLNPMLHNMILERAVLMALRAKINQSK